MSKLTAEERRLNEAVAEMPVSFLRCRTDGHHWDLRWVEVTDYDPTLAQRMLTCAVCDADRLDLVNRRTGMLAHRTYAVPKGYRLMGFGRQTSNRFRAPLVESELLAHTKE